MSKTKRLAKVCPVVASLVFMCGVLLSGASSGQTIAELAELQRAKLVGDLNKPKSDSEAPKPLVNLQDLAMRKLAASSSGLTVYSIFSKGSSIYTAELTDGKNLFTAYPGVVFGPNRIIAVTATGVQVEKVDCKKDCNKSTFIVIGGAF